MLSQLYKAVLSLEALGNPRGLFKKLGTGVQVTPPSGHRVATEWPPSGYREPVSARECP